MRRMGLTIVLTVAFGLLLVGEGWGSLSKSMSFPPEGLTFSQENGYDVVSLKGCEFSTDSIGGPELPARIVSFVIPQDTRVDSVRILYSDSSELPGKYWIYPLQPSLPTDGSDPPPFVPPDTSIYSSSSPYPGRLAEVVGEGYRSGYKIVDLKFYPLQYTPAESTLVLYTEISFTLDLASDSNYVVPIYRMSELSQTLVKKLTMALVENPEDVEGYFGGSMKVEKRNIPQKFSVTSLPSGEGLTVDYVIITTQDLKDSFQRLADWRTKSGLVTQVRTVDWIESHYQGCDLQERIRNFIKDCHRQWGTIYVLIGGDTEKVPVRLVANNFHPTDLYYSGLEGNWNANGNSIFGEYYCYPDDDPDITPDLWLGRASDVTPEEVNTLIDKVFTYEKNPPTDYLKKILLLGGSLEGNDGVGAMDKEELWTRLAYWWYAGLDSLELYGPISGPGWQGDAELNRTNVLAALNSGYHFVNHCDHAGQYCLSTGQETGGGKIWRTDADALTNGPRYSILWTYGCDPNAFDYNCFSEHFMKSANG